MSVRSSPVETVVAVPSHSPSPSLRGARPLSSVLRAGADVGCFSSGRIDGASYPCGAIVSYGDYHLSDTYVITSKGIYQLGTTAPDRLEGVLPGTAQRSVRDSMNTIGGPMYGNTFAYKIYQHGTPFDPATEIASFGAKPVDLNGSDALGKAFEPVMTALAKSYPAGYQVYGFRIA